jgi:16S rRNA (guanine527-N7)-methyltransferase
MDRDELIGFLRRCGVAEARLADLSPMRRLRADLVEANRSTNLTGITGDDDFWLLHLADSLAVGLAAPELMTEALAVADVGCGAGFPMLPLAWANPALAVTGIDGRRRKIEFVRRQIESLGLAKCRDIAGNARELARLPEHAGAYDAVLLRAVGTPGRLLRECRMLPRPGGKIIFYATPAAADEQRELSRRQAGKFGLAMAESPAIALPCGAGERRFVIFTPS